MGVQHSENETYDILIGALLDRSGSMAHLEEAAREHYNGFIREQRNFKGGRARVSLALFDNQYEEVYNNLDIYEVPKLTSEVYYARGSTALLDAVGRFIKTIDSIPNKPSKVVLLINTDGLENASREYKKAQIKDMVTERTQNHDWQIIFVGAGINAFAEGGGLGIGANQTWSGQATQDGMWSTYSVWNNAVGNYRGGATPTVDMNKSGNDLGIKPDAGSR